MSDEFPSRPRLSVRGTVLVGLLLFFGRIAPVSAGDWPQFRGPTGQGLASDTGLPVTFGDAENVLWKTAIPGRGHSSPVVRDGMVWMTTALDGGKSLRAIGVDLASGRMLHNLEVFAPEAPVPVNAKNSHASPTPVLAPGRAYVHFGSMGTAALDTATGNVLWRNEELKVNHGEGPGSSPIVFDDLLIVHCDGKDLQYVVALDRKTGAIRWKTPRSAPFREDPETHKSYSTPLLIEVAGAKQLFSPGSDQAQAYDPKTGAELWQVRYVGFSTVPRPLFADGLCLFCTGYFKPEILAVRPDGKGDVTKTHVAWRFGRQIPANPSPIAVDGLVYFVSDNGVLTCLDLHTGESVWLQRLGGNFWASPVAAEGRLYIGSEEGKVFVLKASRKHEPLATNTLNGPIMGSPAVVDGTLLFRTETHLYRIGLKEK